MTPEELHKAISEINNYYDRKIDELKSNQRSFVQQLINDYANEHNEYKIGDIIEANGTIIKITKITGDYNKYDNYFYPVYFGLVLTKQMKPRKDGMTTNIYGDKGRVITKLK